jgi:glycosyltransferase involved in cell wall biosynthesis
MRVVHITTNAGETEMIGIEKYALDLAVAQKASGSDVTIITNRSGVLSELCRQQGIPVVVEPSLNQSPKESMPALVNQFSIFDADIIHSHTPNAVVQAFEAGNELGIPFVFTFHIGGDNNNNGRFGYRNPVVEVRNAGIRFTTMCVSKTNFEDMKEHGVPETELYYVPQGTTPAPRGHTRKANKSLRPNLIFVGSLSQRKGLDLAIFAMAELRRRRGPDCPVLSIYGNGEGKLEGYYREVVTVLQLDDIVRFCGFQANVLDWCPDSDILLMPSRSEVGPLVVLEAMSRGLPIVASEVGDVREVMPDRRYGRIVPINTIIPLADAVESLLDDIAAGRFDPSLLIERHRSLFTMQKMAERVEAVYKQVLAAANSASS